MGRLFGTDGVRGVANSELTPELAFRLGRAATWHFGQAHDKPMLIIGRDTRVSGQMLEAALAAGICSAGGQAILAGVVPTPAVAYLTRQLGAQAGVVISASHNPFPDNGIKFFAEDGYKLPDAVEDELEQLVLAGDDSLPRPTAAAVGCILHRPDLLQRYIDYAAATVSESFRDLKIVLDCANGAAFEAGPSVYRRLGATVIPLFDQPDGSNINQQCGSTHMEQLQQAVVREGADLGIAHDGDADRCLFVDETGAIVDGDQMMVICALDSLRRGKLKDNTLVATVMSNIGLHQAMKRAGAKLEVTAVGDRYVLEAMREKGFNLGGEQSGHIIFADHSTTGDGIVTALQVLAAMVRAKQPLSLLARQMTRFPQLLVNVRVNSKDGWQDNAAIAAAIRGGEAELGDEGRILVRPSGTEPLIRVMAEGPDQAQLDQLVNRIASVIQQEQSH
ncbi:MAG: phosphoglucosamine mutase [Sporomusaceae bacterium]|nr:phosphoglucosamine mutase [Sporomusaceae bacterium]